MTIKSLRILVVDDESNLAELFAENLIIDGHLAVSAQSAKQAISLVENSEFDVVISDVAMPEITGPEMMKTISQLLRGKPVPPVIFITGHTDFVVPVIAGVRVLGALYKPADDRDVASLLGKI